MEIPGKLVVRTYAPARRWVVLCILLLLAGLALYVMFELGRYKAGYDAMQAAGQRDALQQRIEQPIALPEDFKPDRVTIEVRPGRKGVAPYRRTFVWSVEPG